MGIRFRCHHCEHELHVKDFQGGKRGRCPTCQGKFRIPMRDAEHSLELEDSSEVERPQPSATTVPSLRPNLDLSEATSGTPTSSSKKTASLNEIASSAGDTGSGIKSRSPASPAQGEADTATPPPAPAPRQPRVLSDAPQATWFVRPPSGGQYGPAPSTAMWQWLQENRISRDSLVWCEGWPEWLAASRVFEDFFSGDQFGLGSGANAAAAASTSTTAAPSDAATAGVGLPQPISLSGENDRATRNRATRKQRRKRNYTVLIAILSVVMIVLLVALAIVLNNQQAAA